MVVVEETKASGSMASKTHVENEFNQTVERAQAIADGLLAVFKDPGHDLT